MISYEDYMTVDIIVKTETDRMKLNGQRRLS